MIEEIKKFFKGEVMNDEKTLALYSKDASIFRVKPRVVVFPESSEDLQVLVKWVGEQKKGDASLSIAVRAAGSCMSGGSLNESIIADVTKYMNKVGEVMEDSILTEPGVFYRDFEKKTLEKGLILPCFTASKNLCALGGMIGNNSGGEKTLKYGKMEKYVRRLKMVFADGVEREVKPLTPTELEEKKKQNDIEGDVYRNIHALLENNKEIIENARPKVSKNSAGYYLWNVEHDGLFDLTRLVTGSQGSLGIVTEAEIGLVRLPSRSEMLVIFLKDLKNTGEIINEILKENPETLESYDDSTLKFAARFIPDLARAMGAKNFLATIFSFIPEMWMALSGAFPKLVLLAEFTGDDEVEINARAERVKKSLARFHPAMRLTHSVHEEEKYLTIRRESFNLLRKHSKGRRTAPFIDDVAVRPEQMPEFLPRLRAILDKHKLLYTIAGHAGNGNFHVIPLMDFRDKRTREIIVPVSEEVYSLVKEFGGSITAEHNDGIVRTPFLSYMYSPQILELFEQVKKIFDPQNIFNPGKKVPSTSSGQVGGSIEYLKSHITSE